MKIKKFLSGTIAVALCLLLIGCSAGNKQGANNGKNDNEGKVLKLAFPSTVTSIDAATADMTMLKEVAGVLETLVNVNSDFELQPSLATSWKQTAPKTWEFKLRDDVKFHDGSQFDSSSVKWCFERYLKENPSFTKTTGIVAISTPDKNTVVFETTSETGRLPNSLTNVATCIIAPSSVDAFGKFEKLVGTGYFKQESFDVSTGTFECVAFDGYREKIKSNVTKRIIYSMPDSSTRSLAVQNGEIDIATDVPFSDYKTLASAKGIKVEKFNTARTYFYSYNLKKDFLKDPKVRKALIYAIDKKQIVDDVLMGVGDVPKGIFMDKVPWANNNLDVYDYNVEKAKQLLSEAGFKDTDNDGILDKDGKKFTVRIVSGTRRPGNALIVQATQGYFTKIGVETKVDMLDGNAYNEAIKSGNFDLALNSAATAYTPSADYYLGQYYHSESVNAKDIGYSNSEMDKVIDQCLALSDSNEKNELSKKAQVYAQEDVAVYTVALYGAVFVMNDKVENFSYSAAVHDFIVPYEVSIK